MAVLSVGRGGATGIARTARPEAVMIVGRRVGMVVRSRRTVVGETLGVAEEAGHIVLAQCSCSPMAVRRRPQFCRSRVRCGRIRIAGFAEIRLCREVTRIAVSDSAPDEQPSKSSSARCYNIPWVECIRNCSDAHEASVVLQRRFGAVGVQRREIILRCMLFAVWLPGVGEDVQHREQGHLNDQQDGWYPNLDVLIGKLLRRL